MRAYSIRRRRNRSISVSMPQIKVEKRYRAETWRSPRLYHRDTSRSETRLLPRRLTTPVVEVPEINFPSLSLPRAHVLPQTDAFARKFPRERVLSGEALAKSPVRPTVNLKALYYVRPDVMVCVRRKQRKEVLFALGRAGGSHKKPRYTEESKIICR